MSTIDTSSLWRDLVEAIDFIQDKTLGAHSVEELIALLVSMIETDKSPVTRENFALVYQSYGADKPEFWATATYVREAYSYDSGTTIKRNEEPDNDFPADHPVILQVIKTGKLVFLPSKQACADKNLPTDYQSFLVVPMRLSKEKNRNIGAFILFSKIQEQAFSDELVEIMDIFSNRFAYFIRHNVRKRRNAALQNIQNELFSKHFVRDCELLDEFVQGLQTWFEHDEIVILLKHPLQTNKLMLACCNRNKKNPNDKKLHSIENFRLHPVLTNEEVTNYLGDTLKEHKTITPICLNTQAEIKNHGIGEDCRSWLAAPMRFKTDKDKNIINLGYIILYNKKVEFAFDVDEDQLVGALSDSIAMMLGNLRNERFQLAIKNIKDFELAEHKEKDIQLLYKLVAEELEQLYGVRDLHVFQYARNKLDLKLVHKPKEYFDITPALEEKIKAIIQENAKTKAIDPKKLVVNEDIFIAPMRIAHRSVGCLLFKASHIGGFTALSIDDIADELGEKINEHDRKWRYELLNRFGENVSSSRPINEDMIIEMAITKISEVMFTDNLYIATYDKEKNEISFPFALKNGEKWNEVQGQSRPLNETSKGKTEEIILTGEPILHYTSQESYDWYHEEEKNRDEKANNYLASWVGVPIFSEKGVMGVIAAYHPTLDYVYSRHDVFFLQNIAHQVAGLFRALELEESNKKLEEAKDELIEQDLIISTSLLAQDITHRLKNSVGATIKNIEEIAFENRLVENSKYLADESIDELKTLLADSKLILSSKETEFDLINLIDKVAQQILSSNKINKNLDILKDYSLENIFITSSYRDIFNCLHIVIEN